MGFFRATPTGGRLVAALLATVAAPPAPAQDGSPLPPIERQAGVEYRTGGVGLDESTALEQESRNWPVTMIFAVRAGARSAYTAEVDYVIRDEKGVVALQGKTSGPYLLARLAPGRYAMECVHAGAPRRHAFSVSPGKRHRHVMVWPGPAKAP